MSSSLLLVRRGTPSRLKSLSSISTSTVQKENKEEEKEVKNNKKVRKETKEPSAGVIVSSSSSSSSRSISVLKPLSVLQTATTTTTTAAAVPATKQSTASRKRKGVHVESQPVAVSSPSPAMAKPEAEEKKQKERVKRVPKPKKKAAAAIVKKKREPKAAKTQSLRHVLMKKRAAAARANKPAERKVPADIRSQVNNKFKKLLSRVSTTPVPAAATAPLTVASSKPQVQQQQHEEERAILPVATAITTAGQLALPLRPSSTQRPKLPRATAVSVSPYLIKQTETIGAQRAPPYREEVIIPPATASIAASIYSDVAEKNAARTYHQEQENGTVATTATSTSTSTTAVLRKRGQKRGRSAGKGAGTNGHGVPYFGSVAEDSSSSSDSDSDVEEAKRAERKKVNRSSAPVPRQLVGGSPSARPLRQPTKKAKQSKGALLAPPKAYTVRATIPTELIKDGESSCIRSLEREFPDVIAYFEKKAAALAQEEEEERVDNTNPDTVFGAIAADGGVAPERQEQLGVMATLSLRPYSRRCVIPTMFYWMNRVEVPRDSFHTPQEATEYKEKLLPLVPAMHRDQRHRYNIEVLPGETFPVCENAKHGTCEGLHMLFGDYNFSPRAFFYENEEAQYGGTGPDAKPWPIDRRCSLCITANVDRVANLLRKDHKSVRPDMTIQDYRVNEPGRIEYLDSDLITNPPGFSIGIFNPALRHARNKFALVWENGRRRYVELYGWPGRDSETFF